MRISPISVFRKCFGEATDPLAYQMTNDAMFHIVFETCPDALRALVGALLSLPQGKITSVEVTNPVSYDLNIYSKNFILDLKIILNKKSILNLEMQVEKLNFWKERSLAYLCRVFDSLNRGDQYIHAKPAIQIGILDFSLLPGDAEFYSSYYMTNEITGKKYSDKLRLSVLQLRQTTNATGRDRKWHLDLWAQFFKAGTWEEVLMIAKKDPHIKNAAKTLYRASADERIRNLCEGRERGELTVRTLRTQVRQKSQQLKKQLKRQQEYEKALQQQKEENARLRAKLADLERQANYSS